MFEMHGNNERQDEKAREATLMINFENFQRDFGWRYKEKGEVEAAYERRVRVANGEALTEDEFVIEAGEHYSAGALKKVYARLVELIGEGKLENNDILAYASYKWCLRDEAALVAYQVSGGRWEVNNCGERVAEEQAIIAVNREWGFEASRIEIIGTPYYDATDYQFIRFDCAHMTWLWKNGNLYQAYA